MLRIRCIHSGFLPVSRDRIEQAQELFREAFPQLAGAADKIPDILKRPIEHGYSAAMILLERGMGRVDAFALVLHFPNCKSVLLDYICRACDDPWGRSGDGALRGGSRILPMCGRAGVVFGRSAR